jgi:hypothetical protein
MFTSPQTEIFLHLQASKLFVKNQIEEKKTPSQTSSKCPNLLLLHQEDHRRKEENDPDHQLLDQIYKTEDTISLEDNHQMPKCRISWEIEEADHHLIHLQDFNKTKTLNYNWFNKDGETDLHHHQSQNLTLHHR